MTPLISAPCECPVDVAFMGWEPPQLGWSAQWRMGVHCISPEAFLLYTGNPSPPPPPFGVGVCTSLAGDKPGAVASIPEGAGLNPHVKVFFPNQT